MRGESIRGESITRVRVRYTTYTAALDQYAIQKKQESSNHPSGTAKERLPSIARRIIQAGPRKHRMQAANHASITCYERARWVMCASTQSPRPSP